MKLQALFLHGFYQNRGGTRPLPMIQKYVCHNILAYITFISGVYLGLRGKTPKCLASESDRCNNNIVIILTLGKYDHEGDEKLRKWIYKLGYDHQSVRSVDGKLSCRRTAL